MPEMQLGVIESRFADLIWERVPVTTSEMVKLGEKEFGWKRTTTYTVFKRLCEKGLFENTKGTVTARLSRDEFYALRSRKFVEESFGGSLPAFIAAFTSGKRLSEEEAEKIRQMIDAAEE